MLIHPSIHPPTPLRPRQLMKAKLLGRKTGKGFYLYPGGGKKEKGPRQLNPEAQVGRCCVARVGRWCVYI